MADLIGHELGRYRIIEQLGEGGMAIVYKAYDTRLERDVAVKVIRTERLTEENKPKALKRFEREAKALARLTHPNIVPISDYGEYEGKPYLVMPYLPGGTLKQRLGKPMPWQEAVPLIVAVAEALDYAHSLKMIHRDVKPGNILLTGRGQPMLTDFGIAKLLEGDETMDLTGTSASLGTPEYMAPEQATAKSVDHRADIYSLGIVLYEMLTGRKPFQADTPMAVLIKQATDPLPPPSQFHVTLPDALEKLLLKALAKSPDNRYQNMRELIQALNRLEQEAPGKSRRAPRQPAGPLNLPRWLVPSGITLLGIVVILLLVQQFSPGGILGLFQARVKAEPTAVAQAAVPVSVTQASGGNDLPAGTTMIRPGDSVTMVYVPAGEFIMGSDPDNSKGEMIHTVNLDGFWIDQTEVTNGMYQKCEGAGVCKAPKHKTSINRSSYYGDPEFSEFPVVYVSWQDSQAYCQWVAARLPTEAEWEKAARGPDGQRFPWKGTEAFQDLANYDVSVDGDTTEVGSFPRGASPYGALDMAGNVWEWVADWYDRAYYQNSPINNPIGPEAGGLKVVRGGGFAGEDVYILPTLRMGYKMDYSSESLGFRCARSR